MKISKDSWHYKMLTKDFWWSGKTHPYNISDSLCGYFWQVVFKTIGRTFNLIITPLVILGFALIAPLIQIVGYLSTGYWDTGSIGQAALFFEAAILSVSAVVWTCFWLYEKVKYIKKPKPVNIFTEYVKAKHDKVCPMLEFTDD